VWTASGQKAASGYERANHAWGNYIAQDSGKREAKMLDNARETGAGGQIANPARAERQQP
jgi:hypothetical protein